MVNYGLVSDVGAKNLVGLICQLKPLLLLVVGMSFMPDVISGVYIFSGSGDEDQVTHSSNYSGSGGDVTVTVCIDPASPNRKAMEIPIRNNIFIYNQLRPGTGNLVIGSANNIPSNAFDLESVSLHEMGHCLGLAHPNLATESNICADLGAASNCDEANFTKTTSGTNANFDIDAGFDNVIGSADDLRGDDANLHWFRAAANNPCSGLDSVVDSMTYTRDLSALPGADSFAANADRRVCEALGVPNTESVMQQLTYNDEAQRTLIPDDVAMLRYAMSGIDEIAPSADDYNLRLVYGGFETDGCDIIARFDDARTGFAACRINGVVLSAHHAAITSAEMLFNSNANWFFNDQLLEATNPNNQAPMLAPIGNQTVVEGGMLNIAIAAMDADGDNIEIGLMNPPAFCSLTDQGGGNGSIDCQPTLGDAGTYPVTVEAADDGNPVASDQESFDILVTEFVGEGNSLTQCSTPDIVIPDGDSAGVSDLLIVPDTGVISDIDVSIQAEHPWVGDLIFVLEHADTNTSTVLIDRPGMPSLGGFGCGGNDIEATLDDAAGAPIEDVCATMSPTIAGTFAPTQPLASFNGEDRAGTWRITVIDAHNRDTGTLRQWCITTVIENDPPPPGIAGDFDSDGDVDTVDLVELQRAFFAGDNTSPANMDGDDDIDIFDLNLFQAAWFDFYTNN